jgi:hypothetical protein
VSIDRLSSTSSLIAALRAEIASKNEKTARRDTAGTGRTEQSAGAKPRDVNALRRELAEILKGISPTDTEAMDAARPRVVRAVLLWEFGAELREHSEWQPMLDRLVDTLQRNSLHQDEFARMIRELQA